MKELYKLTGIYRITNLINGKSYVGKTSMNFGDRWDSHRALLRSGSHFNVGLQNDWNELGEESFEFAIVEVVDDIGVLDEREIYYIAKYRECDLCYNVFDGGRSGNAGHPLTDSQKMKIGEKNRVNMTGKRMSDATKKKMSEAQKNRYREWTEDDRAAFGRSVSEGKANIDCSWSEDQKQRFAELQHERPNSATKFTKEKVLEVRAKSSAGVSYEELAIEYNTTPKYIEALVKKKRWAFI